jgi:putative transposase
MPTHFHAILKQLSSDGISIMMRKILDSYSRYFNIKNKRKGPLWESRFNRIVLKSDDELLHLTRYIHLNPVTAYLVEKPEDWPFSSYNEYIGNIKKEEGICNFSGEYAKLS